MTVLLVLATFIVLLSIDHILSRRRAEQTEAVEAAIPRPRPDIVAGFTVPEKLHFHPGHTWALAESPNMVRIGLDDFATRLIGKFEAITLPRRGQWVRQGQKVWSVKREGTTTEMVSPIEGIVTDVNQAVIDNPELARRDPYGEGWLLTVQAPDLKTSFRNLLGGSLARRWMEEAAIRLRSRMPALAGAFAQDGGVAVEDLSAQLPDEIRDALTKEFFLI